MPTHKYINKTLHTIIYMLNIHQNDSTYRHRRRTPAKKAWPMCNSTGCFGAKMINFSVVTGHHWCQSKKKTQQLWDVWAKNRHRTNVDSERQNYAKPLYTLAHRVQAP